MPINTAKPIQAKQGKRKSASVFLPQRRNGGVTSRYSGSIVRSIAFDGSATNVTKRTSSRSITKASAAALSTMSSMEVVFKSHRIPVYSNDTAITIRMATIAQMNRKRRVPKPPNVTRSPLQSSPVALTPLVCWFRHASTWPVSGEHPDPNIQHKKTLDIDTRNKRKLTPTGARASDTDTMQIRFHAPLRRLPIHRAQVPIQKLPALSTSANTR